MAAHNLFISPNFHLKQYYTDRTLRIHSPTTILAGSFSESVSTGHKLNLQIRKNILLIGVFYPLSALSIYPETKKKV
ncbi:hypothetical protein PRIPAC_89315 [Pristionchus pacificus]|uniref:Uncharacterized protein n=1 Tax=Pristionchus pacificus TaxID=54126 RepID=A0A2A6CT73_PRIPA|nr:hypothetical protein PRIPAC_89315 [Pristionchus pacificus]|eukprot:PDM81424.1 hypothetical protein PRIPAC_35300 [Pristionchus pacificus]